MASGCPTYDRTEDAKHLHLSHAILLHRTRAGVRHACGLYQQLACVMAVNWLTIRKFSELTGYSENAIRTKIRDGVWIEGRVWKKAPDGRNLISVDGYNQWVENNVLAPSLSARPQSKSPLPIKERDAGRRSNLTPPPLT